MSAPASDLLIAATDLLDAVNRMREEIPMNAYRGFLRCIDSQLDNLQHAVDQARGEGRQIEKSEHQHQFTAKATLALGRRLYECDCGWLIWRDT
jgi:hypothetical protein